MVQDHSPKVVGMEMLVSTVTSGLKDK